MKQTHFPIGVFDSGIGGLSILKALRQALPQRDFVYFADTLYNPYGEKSEAFIQERSLAITRQLVEQHRIATLVVACNTATAAAIHLLRQEWPALPIVGVEPALKPAVAVSKTKHIGVLATQGTLRSAKFAALKESLETQAKFVCVPCEGLAERIEQLSENHAGMADAINFIANLLINTPAIGNLGSQNGQIDTIVLGCTHYPLLMAQWQQLIAGKAQIVDNAQAVAARTAQLLAAHTSALANGSGKICWESSGPLVQLEKAAAYWLNPARVNPL
jgi:glutamate racemase